MVDRFLAYFPPRRIATEDQAGDGREMPLFVQGVIQGLSRMEGFPERFGVIQASLKYEPGFIEVEPMRYRYGEYFFRFAPQPAADREAANLRMVRGIGLAMAPQVIRVLPSHYGQAVVATRFPGIPEGMLRRYTGAFEDLPGTARENFRRDLQMLLHHRLVNGNVIGDVGEWWLESGGRRIIVFDWESLRPIGEGEEPKIPANLCRTIFDMSAGRTGHEGLYPERTADKGDKGC